MNSLYFAYGANMHPKSMKARCPAAVPIGSLKLRDWHLEFYNHATIVPEPGAHVPGVLWSITKDCEIALDAFEGYPTYYTKRNWHQNGLDFFFYEMTPSNQFGRPGTAYVSNIIDSYCYWDMPRDPSLDTIYAACTDQKTQNI
jgi:hypothetical protein